jgi:hypothetical protein
MLQTIIIIIIIVVIIIIIIIIFFRGIFSETNLSAFHVVVLNIYKEKC